MITKKLRIFHPRPNNFVIVNCETITLLTRGLSPDGQQSRERATDDLRETFLRMQLEFHLLKQKVTTWTTKCRVGWCARCVGGVHVVHLVVHISCVRGAARVCVARCTFRRPGGHFWSLGRILVPFLVHFGRGRHLGPWVAGFSWFWSGFSSIFRHFDPFFTVLVGIFDENRSK